MIYKYRQESSVMQFYYFIVDQPTSHDVDVLMLMGDVDDDEDENIPCLLQRLVTALKDQKDEFQALKPLASIQNNFTYCIC